MFNWTPLLREMRRGMRKFLPEYKKVVFRAYEDEKFLVPVDIGELQKHLGIMGPFIRTEVNNLLTVSHPVTKQNKRTNKLGFSFVLVAASTLRIQLQFY